MGSGDWSAMIALAPLYGMAFAFLLAVSAFAKLEPYYVAYVLGSPVWAGALAIAGACGVMLSQPVWERVIASLERGRGVRDNEPGSDGRRSGFRIGGADALGRDGGGGASSASPAEG